MSGHRFTVRREDGIGPHPDSLTCRLCGVPKGAHGAPSTFTAACDEPGCYWQASNEIFSLVSTWAEGHMMEKGHMQISLIKEEE